MVTSRAYLINALHLYNPVFAEEKQFCYDFIKLLQEPACYQRHHLPGHITGSSWIIDETRQYVLLTHHAKLGKWLQPGGHADGDENIYAVALREGEEETGLKNLKPISRRIFDIDIHSIPARSDFPEHLHYDVRFIFEADRNASLSITEESHDLQWILWQDLEALTTNDSLRRMKKKTLALFAANE